MSHVGEALIFRYLLDTGKYAIWSFKFPPGVRKLLEELTEEPADAFGAPLEINHIRMIEGGFAFRFEILESLYEISYEPEEYPEFRREHGELLDDVSSNGGNAPALALRAFQAWLKEKYTAKAVEDLKSGAITFADIQRDNPSALREQPLAEMLVEAYISGSIDPPRHQPINSAELELYYLACMRYVNKPDQSLFNCCADVVEEYPELVPSTWVADPAKSLEKIITRKWDKTPWSLKEERLKARPRSSS